MKKIINLVLFISIASAFVLGQAQGDGGGGRQKNRRSRPENPPAASTPAAGIFSADLPLLKDGTRVPILLPGELLSGVAGSQIKVTSATSDESGYEISLATGEDCGDACFVGTFSATPDDGHAAGAGEDGSHAVRLARGIKGSYTPRTCGGSCTPPSISWLYGRHAYYIQFNVRGGTPAQEESNMIRMANSAIEGGAR
jgi:hypothetical protein